MHGAELIQKRVPTKYKVVGPRRRRVTLYRQALENFCSLMPKARVFNAHLNKENPAYPYTPTPEGIQTLVWGRMLERYNRFLRLSCGGDMGMIFADETDEVRIRKLVRKMRVFNYAGSHFGGGYADPLTHLIEDPVMRRSENSYFVQISDLISHALYRKLYPKGSLRTYNVDLLFDAVKPCLHLPASRKDPHKMGIVHC